jgi:hydroxyacylglutathione hydrolase
MLERLKVGPIGENAYVLAARGPAGEKDRCILVDPGDEGGRILAFLDGRGLTPLCIVATHGHLDHTAAIPDILEAFASRGIDVPIAAHPLDAGYFGDRAEKTNRGLFTAIRALGYFTSYWRPIPEVRILLSDGDAIIGSAYRVIHTPGHTAGSVCLYDEASGILVSGDTLFRDGVGRTDGPDSDGAALEASLARLLALPPGTKVFPGHGEPTTIGREAGVLGLENR